MQERDDLVTRDDQQPVAGRGDPLRLQALHPQLAEVGHAVHPLEPLLLRHLVEDGALRLHRLDGDLLLLLDDAGVLGAVFAAELGDHLARGALHLRVYFVGSPGALTPANAPANARLPMRAEAHDKTLGCASCHGAHRFDTRQAAVQACQGCHDDGHTKAYAGSPHHDLWLKELAGELPAGAGVSCASCHMPRVRALSAHGEARTLVQHNQNDTLRPAEKMIRPVCQACHGLGLAIDALADPALAARNFRGAPRVHIRSIDMARARAERSERPSQPSKGEQ